MGNMGSRLRKGRAAYERSVGKKHQELKTQEGYIRDYNKLLKMGPNPPTKKVLVHAGKRGRPDSWAEGFSFVSEWDYANRHRYRGRRSMNQWHYSTNYRPVESYPGLLEDFKKKAINAEMYGIPAAKKAIAGIKPMDLSYIRSARGKSGGLSESTKKAKAEAAHKAVMSTADYSNPDFQIKKVVRYEGLSPATIKAQKELSEEFGIVTFDVAGKVSTAPSSGKINWKAMGLDSMSGERKKQIKSELGDEYVRQDIARQANKINETERELNKQIADIESKLTGLDNFENIKWQLKEVKRKKGMGLFANEDFEIKTKQTDTKEMKDLRKQLSKLKAKKKTNLEKRYNIGSAIESVGRNEFYEKIYESGKMDDMTASMLLTTTKDESRDRNIMIVEQKSLEQKSVQNELNVLSRFERRLNKLQREKSTSGQSASWKQKRDKLYEELNQAQITVGKGATIKSALGSLSSIINQKSDQFKQIKDEKNLLSLNISQGRTNPAALSFASDVNFDVVKKKEFEKLTGIDVGDSTPNEALAQYYNQMNTKGLSGDGTKHRYVYTDDQGDAKVASINQWYGNWLYSGGGDLMRKHDDIDLLLGKEMKTDARDKTRQAKGILDKYSAWGQASEFIGETIGEFRGDLKSYYDSNYRNATSAIDGSSTGVNVSESTISRHWFGTSNVEGESFTTGVANEIGIRDYGADGGMGTRKDVENIIKKSKNYHSILGSEADKVRSELDALKQKQIKKQETHRELKSQITDKVNEGVSKVRRDEAFADKLSKSSQELYDLNFKIAEKSVAIKYYEKSMTKTQRDIDKFERQKKQLDYDIVQGTSSSGLINRIKKTGQYGRSQSNKFRRNTGSVNRRGKTGIPRRAKGLGGLVK